MGVMQIISPSGDDKIFWNPEDDKQLDHAESEFNKYIEKGFRAYRMDDKGNKAGVPVKIFPPDASRLLFVPVGRVAGG